MKQHRIQTMRLSDLDPAPYNPRAISPDAMAGLEASLARFGLVQPIIWNERTGRIVGGHQRCKALAAHGEVEAQVVVVDMDDVDEKALNVALNNQHISGEFTPELQALLDEISSGDPLGFSELRLDELVEDIDVKHVDIEEWSADDIHMPEGVVLFAKVPHAERLAIEDMVRASYPGAVVYSHLDFSGEP